MAVHLTDEEQAVLGGTRGTDGARMALSIVREAAEILGAERLVPIVSSHIDGCLYHGASGTLFCEKLVELGAKTAVPTTTNVGALNLLKPDQSRLTGQARKMAYRLMVAHEKMGCRPSWTCAPYQAGARPLLGEQVAWGESNAVAFCNTVLGARTNRYGDFLDIACAVSGRAPFVGLHRDEARAATIVLDVSRLPENWQQDALFFPVLGALIGRLAGHRVAAVTGLQPNVREDDLKALCAAAAATGAVGLIQLVGISPEAPDLATALGQRAAKQITTITTEMMRDMRDGLSETREGALNAVALGSPHFSVAECKQVLELAGDRAFTVPVYICLGRHTLDVLKAEGMSSRLEGLGCILVTDTCVVVTPIFEPGRGVLMTNSAKFAHYAKGNTGYSPVLSGLAECLESAQTGRIVARRDNWK